ncbi:MAG TPA: hypothetical protein VGH76_08170 [Actinomycetospora sp.]|uniref:hypothetical protein n=1 Tax=Actinomycetospora sp. TaxID=1872135 RepID=UPI002F424602
MTSQVPVETTRTTPDGDAFPALRTESPGVITDRVITDRVITDPGADAPTGALAIGADDAAVRGVDEVLGREVRLVTLPPAAGELLSERIEQVRHLARLHHPHLLEVYDVDGLAPDTESTLVLENVPGEPLALVLRDGPIGEPELARMGAQLASALAHAHAHGVEHGAIGAASVLVDRAHADAWLVGLTASLSGPLPVVGEQPDDGEDAARRRAADVRALAAVLSGVLEHAAAVVGGDDPEAVTRPSARDDTVPDSPLAALLRDVETDPPGAAVFSEQLVRVGRGVAAREGRAEPARLVPVVASWAESPALPGAEEQPVPAALAGPAVRARGRSGITPFSVTSPAGRRARRAAVLGAATATLALASGLVIWAGEAHLVRPESQAEIGASAPSAIPAAPLLPRAADAGASDGGGSDGGSDSGSSGTGDTWTGVTAGSTGGTEHGAVGVAARPAAVREAVPSTTTERSPETGTRSDPPSQLPGSGPTPPTHPDGPPASTDPTTTPTTTRPTTTPSTTKQLTKPSTSTQRTTQPTTTQRTATSAPTRRKTSTATSSATDPTTGTATDAAVAGTEAATATSVPPTTTSAATVLAAGM